MCTIKEYFQHTFTVFLLNCINTNKFAARTKLQQLRDQSEVFYEDPNRSNNHSANVAVIHRLNP